MGSDACLQRALLIGVTSALLGSCAAATQYQGIPPPQLTDAQLVEELYSFGIGVLVGGLYSVHGEPVPVPAPKTST